MAWEGTLCTEEDIDAKVGANVSGSFTQAMKNSCVKQAESFICILSREDWVASYASLTASKKYTLNEAASNLTAIYAIMWDMSGYTSRIEAEDMVNLLWARFMHCMGILENRQSVEFLGEA